MHKKEKQRARAEAGSTGNFKNVTETVREKKRGFTKKGRYKKQHT